MGMNPADVEAMQSRLAARRTQPAAPDKPAPAPRRYRESDLHRMIQQDCLRRGLVAFHARMDRPTTTQLGMPDFVILLPKSRILLVECKTPTGRLSEEQTEMCRRAADLDHEVHVVRSFQEFHGLVLKALHVGQRREP